jgi:tetratricopeptide (TPR) repeat protein
MMSGHTHFTVAYFLLRARATGQALSELRVAAERSPALRPRAAEWAIRYVAQPEDALRVVPDGPDGVTMLLVLAGSSRLQAQRFDLLEEATARDPSSMLAHTAAARTFLAALESAESSTCHFAQQAICLEHLDRHLLAIARLEPGSSLATELTARMLTATGRAGEARALLSSTCSSFARPAACWQARIGLGRDQVSDQALHDALQAYHTAACTNDDACIRASTWLGATLESRGDNMGALEYYSRAIQAGGDNARTWLAIARVARAAGQPKRANEALQRAQRSAKDPDLRRQLDRNRLNSLAEEHPH